MGLEKLEEILTKNAKDIVTAITLAVKEVGGSYARRPLEEIYDGSEKAFRAFKTYLLERNFQPLVDFADRIARRRALDHFRLHEVMRASLSFKIAIYPFLFETTWEDPDDLEASVLLVDNASDRFSVNLAQAYIHYAKDKIAKDPMEFPVWMDISNALKN